MQTRKCQTRVPNAVAWGLTSSIRKSDDPVRFGVNIGRALAKDWS